MSKASQAALFSLASSTLLSLFGQVEAATIKAKSVSLEDVSSAVASAKDGDIVIVPAGTATWTAPLNIANNITLQGAGAASTIIIDEAPLGGGKLPREVDEIHRGTVGKQSRRRADSGPKQPLEVDEVAGRPGKQSRRTEDPGLRSAKPTKARSGTAGPDRKQPSYLISISLDRDLPFRMTGFTFKGGTLHAKKSAKARIQIRGNSHSFRVDHCTFDEPHAVTLNVDGFLWGVIDHCQFKTNGSHPIVVGHKTWNGKNWGHGSWADDPYWGSAKFVFIEDNVFEDTSRGGKGIDSFEGARFVVRYNQFHKTRLVMHGTQGQGRGAKQLEEYNNTYVFDQPNHAGQIRSGSIITHDNTWTNVAKGHVLQQYRYYQESPHWGPVDGENLWDKNVPNGGTGYWATGTHTGPNGATVLEDTNANKIWWDNASVKRTGAWPIDRWREAGACYMVRNKTRENTLGTIRTFALANAANTITCSDLSFKGDRVTFDSGDTYEIWKVSQSLDQPGMGKSDLLVGLGDWKTKKGLTTPYADPHQVAEPCYSWNNTLAGTSTALNLGSPEPAIKEGRDFFNGTPKPGYKPYTYPHPLVTGEPDAPKNLKVVP